MPSPRWTMLTKLANALRLATRAGGPSLGERLASLPRLVRSVMRGEYAGANTGRILMMVAALGWIVSPVDLLPEALLGVFGLVDDAMVASWLVTTVVLETENYLAWEKGIAAPGATGATGSPASASVRSSVVG